jgi:hypothetical protein
MPLHTPTLLAFLQHRADTTRSPLAGAIYTGLIDRIRRGDFDDKDAA